VTATAAQALAEQQERTLAAALQRLSGESVVVRDIMTMTGLGEKYVTRLLRLNLSGGGGGVVADRDSEVPVGAGVEVGRAAG